MAVRTGVRVVILVLLLDFAVFVVPVALVNALIVLLKQLPQSVYHDKLTNFRVSSIHSYER